MIIRVDRDILSIAFALTAVAAACSLWWVWRRKESEFEATRAGLERKLSGQISADELVRHGVSLLEKGSLTEAIAELKRALEERPKDAQLHHTLGQAQFLLGNPQGAILHYDSAIRLNPHYAEAHVSRGVALEARNFVREARSAYMQAIAIDSAIGPAHYNLARSYASEGDCARATQALRNSIQADPAYLAEAKGDPEFEKLYSNEDFCNLVYGSRAAA